MKLHILLISGLLTTTYSMHSQTMEAKSQSTFIYNFLLYIQWPENILGDEFVVGVTGNQDVYNTLTEYMTDRKIAGKRLKVVKCATYQDMGRCNIVYVAEKEFNKLETIANNLRGKSCLVVFENTGGFESFAGIDLVFNENKPAFKINQKYITSQNLKISNQLLKMSI